jgi:hypothetical protein
MPQIRGAVKKFNKSFDIEGLVLDKFVPPGHSVTGQPCES